MRDQGLGGSDKLKFRVMIGVTGDRMGRSKIWPVVPAPLLIKISFRDPNFVKMVASRSAVYKISFHSVMFASPNRFSQFL